VARGALIAVLLASSLWVITSGWCPAASAAPQDGAIAGQCSRPDETRAGDSGAQWHAWHQLPAAIHESSHKPSAIRDITSALLPGMDGLLASGPRTPARAVNAAVSNPSIHFPLLI